MNFRTPLQRFFDPIVVNTARSLGCISLVILFATVFAMIILFSLFLPITLGFITWLILSYCGSAYAVEIAVIVSAITFVGVAVGTTRVRSKTRSE
jgi:predicted membrane metal-binding protein